MTALRICLFSAATLMVSLAADAAEPQNPFDVPGFDEVVDASAKEFASQIQFGAIDSDVNADPWPPKISKENPMFFAGIWSGRWNNRDGDAWNFGSAKVVRRGDRLYIHFSEGDVPSGGYMIEAVRQSNGIYVGRYGLLGSRVGSGYWIGRVVSSDRIDGYWTTNGGRWDLRRRFE